MVLGPYQGFEPWNPRLLKQSARIQPKCHPPASPTKHFFKTKEASKSTRRLCQETKPRVSGTPCGRFSGCSPRTGGVLQHIAREKPGGGCRRWVAWSLASSLLPSISSEFCLLHTHLLGVWPDCSQEAVWTEGHTFQKSRFDLSEEGAGGGGKKRELRKTGCQMTTQQSFIGDPIGYLPSPMLLDV